MPKFSIIIPVYNVEKYIKKCLDSVFNQTYKDFEVIVVNDGTKDNSMEIVKKYDVRIIDQKNQGLSAARNSGAKIAKGEYIIFIDSDDYIEKNLLKNLNNATKGSPDIIRFQIQEVSEKTKEVKKYEERPFANKTGEEAFSLITKYHFVENAWAYAIKNKYYKDNQFSFAKGTIHEDFGLIPLIIIKANKVSSISYIGYNYLQRDGSIMSEKNYEKTKKKVSDTYRHYLYLISEIDKTELNKNVFKSFCANNLLIKICELKGKDYREYRKKLKEQKVYDNLLSDTVKRKIKKILFIINPKLTIKILK